MSKKKQVKHEVRVLAPQKFEVRRNSDGTRTVSGHAIVYNSLSQDIGGFFERAQPGCLTESLKNNSNTFLLYQHDYATPLARTDNGSLVLSDSSDGLHFSASLPDTTYARDLAALMDSNTVHDMSFGFSVPKDGDSWSEENGAIVRTLKRIQLFEISCVTAGAYEAPHASLRSCPASMRAKLKRKSDDDVEDDPEADTEDQEKRSECECDCDACEEGDCEDCDNEDCDDPDCDDCPIQDTRQAQMSLLIRRLRA